MEQFSIPPGYKLVPLNMKIGSSNSGIIVRMIGSVIFLVVLVIVFMISKMNSEQQLKLRQMELQNEQLASKGQVIMDTISVEPVSVGVEKKVLSTSPTPAMDLNKNTTTSQDLSPAPQTKWKVHSNKDAKMGTRDVFHLHTQTTPRANLKNCLEKCAKSSECGAVITDNSKSLCWGKTNITNTFSDGDRIIYEKSEYGVLEPWNISAPASASAPVPAPAPASNVSTNGRCGPKFNNTICPGKQCCSASSWCAGTQGTSSAWCYSNKKGRNNGEYDGKSN
jgi:hypothetical protein